MKTVLSTKELAEALGVSESSLRRWTDSGAIQTTRTVGGHRRIPVGEAIRFIRQHRANIARPELLGLPGAASAAQRLPEPRSADEEIHDALAHGDEELAKGRLFSLYLTGTSIAALCDGPIRHAMSRIGELWQHGPNGILVEHRATDICVQAMNQLRQWLPNPGPAAPTAVGGAPENDPYLLPSLMAATVLADAGVRPINYGPNTPVGLLAEAVETHHAAIAWLSVSAVGSDLAALREAISGLAARLEKRKTTLLLGGRHADELPTSGMKGVHSLRSMGELAAFARGAVGATAR